MVLLLQRTEGHQSKVTSLHSGRSVWLYRVLQSAYEFQYSAMRLGQMTSSLQVSVSSSLKWANRNTHLIELFERSDETMDENMILSIIIVVLWTGGNDIE